jgi:hypothetical protein
MLFISKDRTSYRTQEDFFNEQREKFLLQESKEQEMVIELEMKQDMEIENSE